MKFASLYSNQENIFPAIYFRAGFNVVFAQVREPKAKNLDSHNLGKSFLIKVLDFCLLGRYEKSHPFHSHPDIFEEFEFYLEIETVDGSFVTIKRAVRHTKVSIHVEATRNKDLREVPDRFWLHPSLPSTEARKILNDLLSLTTLSPYDYRKGLGYFLRSQSEFEEVFKISKFQKGSDRDWKPFLALLLGLDYELINKKYEIDQEIKELEIDLQRIEKRAGSKSNQYDDIKGQIVVRRDSVEKMRRQIEGFNFQEIESIISETSVRSIEAEIASLNKKRYKLSFELQEIEKSLLSEYTFDIDKIEQIFGETGVVFPEQLLNDYQSLIEFNRRMSVGRRERLIRLKDNLEKDLVDIEARLVELNRSRQESLKILQDMETLSKYKGLQAVLINAERELLELRQKLTELDSGTPVQRDIENKRQELLKTVTDIRVMVIENENSIYSSIRSMFSKFVEHILNVPAVLSVNINQHGNIDPQTRTLDSDVTQRETNQSAGNTYKKILAACFDLALLTVYAEEPFYRFAYHDGIFEGLDNRKKANLLEVVRDVCNEYGVQYILTVIDADLPRDDRDQKLLFTHEEVIRSLHDQGANGRLFRTREF